MEYHYTYLLTCKQTNHKYFGVRKSKVPPNEDIYWSSSRTVKSMMKQGYTFSKEIDNIYNSREEAVYREYDYHRKFNVANNKDYLNKSNQPLQGYDAVNAGKLGGKASQKTLKRLGKGLYDSKTKSLGGKKTMSISAGKKIQQKGVKYAAIKRMKESTVCTLYHVQFGKVIANTSLFRLAFALDPSNTKKVQDGKWIHYRGWKVI